MSQRLLTPSLLASSLSSNSPIDRYLALHLVRDLTVGQTPLHPVHIEATLSLRRLVDGHGANGNAHFTGLIERHSNELSSLVNSEKARGLLQWYHSLQDTLAPLRTLPPSVVSPRPESGDSSIARFLNDLAADVLKPTLPEIAFYEERQLSLHEERPGSASRQRFSEGCLELFGCDDVTLEDLAAGFFVDIPGYRLKRLDLEFFPQGHLDIRGLVVDDGDNTVGSFCRVIPVRPPEGHFWVARSQGIAFSSLGSGQRKGLGRHLTQRYLAFLKRLGVDALDFLVSDVGTYVFPKLGFDFANTATRDRIKILFREYLRRNFPDLDPIDEIQWAKIQHAWEIASFRLSRTNFPAGEAFLADLGAQGDFASFRVRFLTDLSYPGWGLLFGDRVPPEWSDLEPSTGIALKTLLQTVPDAREVMFSFQRHLIFLHSCLNSWITPFIFYPRGWEEISQLDTEGEGNLVRQLEKSIQILAWMSREYERGSELGHAFWNTLHPRTKELLPIIVRCAQDLFRVEIRIPESVGI